MVAISLILPTRQSSSSSVKSALRASNDKDVNSSLSSSHHPLEEDDAITTASTTGEDSSSFTFHWEASEQQTDASPSVNSKNSTNVNAEIVRERRVRFGTLQIHEHVMVLGGNGVPRMGGPPVSLSWERQTHYEVSSAEEYDELKTFSRKGEQLCLTKEHRITILAASGSTMREIKEATSASDEIRARRMAVANSAKSPMRKIQGAFRKAFCY